MLRKVVVSCAMIALSAGVAQAQKIGKQDAGASPRQGFFFSVGGGAGSVGIDCAVCSEDRETGLSGNLRLGAAISPQFTLAIGTNGWFKSEDVLGTTLTTTFGWLNVLAIFYPSKTAGFWIQAGAGLMFGKLDDEVDQITSAGPGGILGVGYDFMIGRTISLAPYINFLASQGNLKFNGLELLDEDFNPNLVQFGLAFSVH
jgi:hypothetical protein